MNNVLRGSWNGFLFAASTYSITRIWVNKLFRFFFKDFSKLGQKLQWYDTSTITLVPDTIESPTVRIWINSLFAGTIFFVGEFQIYGLNFHTIDYADMINVSGDTELVKLFFNNIYSKIYLAVGIYSLFWLIIAWFEGQTRVIERSLIQLRIRIESQKWKFKLPEIPFDPESEDFNLCFFTVFKDDSGENSKKPTGNEEWLTLDKDTLTTNILTIAPIDSGKTQDVIIPAIEQAVAYRAKDKERKGSLTVYNVKGGLTKHVVDAAKRHNREDDLCILSLKENSKYVTNVIRVENIYHEATSWQIAGWVVNAWQNFQGKSSPEPYWSEQSFYLCRNIILLEYAIKGRNTSITSLAKRLLTCSNGVYKKIKTTKGFICEVTPFGQDVFKVFLATLEDEEEMIRAMSDYIFVPQDFGHEYSREIITKASERLINEQREFYEVNDLKDLKELGAKIERIKQQIQDAAGDEQILFYLEDEYKSLVDEHKETKKIIRKKQPEWDAREISLRVQTELINESRLLRDNLLEDVGNRHLFDKFADSLKDVVKDFIDWSESPSENNYSVVSNMKPFLGQFRGRDVERVLSSNESNLDFDKIVNEGTLLVPDFTGREIGKQMASAMITLIKARWQYGVLSTGTKDSVRPKGQIVDEAQEVVVFGHEKYTGEFEYMELSREFYGWTLWASQSWSALLAKANDENNFNKLHGVMRTIITYATNDTAMLKKMEETPGTENVTRSSQSISESASTPTLNAIGGEFHGSSDSLNYSISKTESPEAIVQKSMIHSLPGHTAIAFIYKEKKNNIMCLGFRPHYWKEKTDKWVFIERCKFLNKNRFWTKWNLLNLW